MRSAAAVPSAAAAAFRKTVLIAVTALMAMTLIMLFGRRGQLVGNIECIGLAVIVIDRIAVARGGCAFVRGQAADALRGAQPVSAGVLAGAGDRVVFGVGVIVADEGAHVGCLARALAGDGHG